MARVNDFFAIRAVERGMNDALIRITDRMLHLFAARSPGQALRIFVTMQIVVLAFTHVLEVRLLQVPGMTLWEEAKLVPIIAAPFIAFAMAVATRQAVLMDQLAEIASTDQLTGLPNRRAFMVEVERLRARMPTATGMLAIADVDHFKQVNDTLGHGEGDRCLIEISRHLKAHCADIALCCRLGGEEFALYMPGSAPDDARDLAGALCRGIPFAGQRQITLSAGFAEMPPGDALRDGLRRADLSLYRAKDQGRAQAVLWPGRMLAAAAQPPPHAASVA